MRNPSGLKKHELESMNLKNAFSDCAFSLSTIRIPFPYDSKTVIQSNASNAVNFD